MKNLTPKTISQEAVRRALENLPVTRDQANQYTGILSDCVVLHVNHPLDDVYAFNEILTNVLGAKLYFIGVPYSNKFLRNPEYYQAYSIRRGLRFETYLNGTHEETLDSDDLVELLKGQIMYILEKEILQQHPEKKIIILQDGGYTAHLKNLGSSDYMSELPNLIGMVEQTQSGSQLFKKKFSEIEAKYPVISISRSSIKTRFESTFIAQRVFEELNSLFNKRGDFLRFKTVIVGGYGVIGRQLARYLRSIDMEVIVFDKDATILRLARKEGFFAIDKLTSEEISEAYCYIGCTGTNSFGTRDFEQFLRSDKESFFLVSGSSKRTEFLSLIYLFERPESDVERQRVIAASPLLSQISNINVETDQSGLIYNFEYRGRSRKIYLLAEGFPINMFDPDSESLPDRVVDPIQTLLIIALATLKKSHEQLTDGLHFLGREELGHEINEDAILRKWAYMNQIHIPSDNILRFFPEHPLQELLTARKA